jgi:hypothetical protein
MQSNCPSIFLEMARWHTGCFCARSHLDRGLNSEPRGNYLRRASPIAILNSLPIVLVLEHDDIVFPNLLAISTLFHPMISVSILILFITRVNFRPSICLFTHYVCSRCPAIHHHHHVPVILSLLLRFMLQLPDFSHNSAPASDCLDCPMRLLGSHYHHVCPVFSQDHRQTPLQSQSVTKHYSVSYHHFCSLRSQDTTSVSNSSGVCVTCDTRCPASHSRTRLAHMSELLLY